MRSARSGHRKAVASSRRDEEAAPSGLVVATGQYTAGFGDPITAVMSGMYPAALTPAAGDMILAFFTAAPSTLPLAYVKTNNSSGSDFTLDASGLDQNSSGTLHAYRLSSAPSGVTGVQVDMAAGNGMDFFVAVISGHNNAVANTDEANSTGFAVQNTDATVGTGLTTTTDNEAAFIFVQTNGRVPVLGAGMAAAGWTLRRATGAGSVVFFLLSNPDCGPSGTNVTCTFQVTDASTTFAWLGVTYKKAGV